MGALTTLPSDYDERVYAGVLGKIIGVYLGRPFEGWEHQRILDELGEITYYVNDWHDVALKNHLLIVADDDISGTFVFPRALRDHDTDDPTPAQVGESWLNYLLEGKTVLWWGGLGNSTEHTAYLRLRAGETAPSTGSAARNGRVVAEQVGAQIFVEGWAMTCPGDPERAANLAEAAASVSHDGEALHAARVVAALVAQSFVETDVGRLLDAASSLIDKESLIHRVVDDVRTWHAGGDDWRAGFARIQERYGYDRYGGNCHVVPNHALVINALVHSAGEFSRAMTIVNTCGWDTDSNAGNVGAICGVRGGLAGLGGAGATSEAGAGSAVSPDWRGPLADRMYLPSADGGATITDAAREAVSLALFGRRRAGQPASAPKDGARFHFSFPGAVQGFTSAEPGIRIDNAAGDALAIHWPAETAAAHVLTPTFVPPEAVDMRPYGIEASPTLHPGQRLTARVAIPAGTTAPVECGPVLYHYDSHDELTPITGPGRTIPPGEAHTFTWTVPDTGAQPIAKVGLAIRPVGGHAGAALLDWLTWDGAPAVSLTRPARGGRMWRHAWVNAVDKFDDHPRWTEPSRLIQNRGEGLLAQGSRDWHDYEVSADVTPHVAESVGLAARVQGLTRWYGLRLVRGDTVELVRSYHHQTVLATHEFAWTFGRTYDLSLRVVGRELTAAVDSEVLFRYHDPEPGLESGGVGLLVTEGRTATSAVNVRPADHYHGNDAR
jgi:ADP-ribosylglycohydrolase